MNIFIDLVAKKSVTTQAQLKRVYRNLLKRLHPDLDPRSSRKVDFDQIKNQYLEAKKLLAETERVARAEESKAAGERERFIQELRDLVARGLPINERAVLKNKEYKRSIEYVASCLRRIFNDEDRFVEVNGQLGELRDSLPRIYWYSLQILWNCFDFMYSGFVFYRRTARRHYDFIEPALRSLEYAQLNEFLKYLLAEMDAGAIRR